MNVGRVLGTTIVLGLLVLAVFVMVNGIGLVDTLDFGAGAYYYADIPEFDRFGGSGADFSGSAIAVIAFFVIWSLIVLGLLKLVKLIPKPSDEEDRTLR